MSLEGSASRETPSEDRSVHNEAPKVEQPSEEKASKAYTTSEDVTRPRRERRSDAHAARRLIKKPRASSSATSDSSSDSNESSELTSSSDSSGEETRKKKKSKNGHRKSRNGKRRQQKRTDPNCKQKKRTGADDPDSDVSESEYSEDQSSEEDKDRTRRRRHKVTGLKRKMDHVSLEGILEKPSAEQNAQLCAQIATLQLSLARIGGEKGLAPLASLDITHGSGERVRSVCYDSAALKSSGKQLNAHPKKARTRHITKRASTLEYKRVDQLWDSSIHNYKLKESANDHEDEFEQCIFMVRRRFDWENKYKNTVVDIKSKILRGALQEVMSDVMGVSLVEDQPCVDPNMLFLYLGELREYRKTLKSKAKEETNRKEKKKLQESASQVKVLLKYLDEDYNETKKTLYPMLQAGHITFDLLWALFKPNTLAYTTTYNNADEPRCFKVEYATKESSFMRGEWYSIEGRYLEYDGKSFGLGEFETQIDAFKGPRKITSLGVYPLEYHRDPEGLKRQLIERGKKFVATEGMKYRFHTGMAFMKKKKTVAKVNINGRIMVDPSLFRRINPNYPISLIKPQDPKEMTYELGEDCSNCCSSEEEEAGLSGDSENVQASHEEKDKERTRVRFIRDKADEIHMVEVAVDEHGQELLHESFDKLPEVADPKQKRDFSEEELLIASPVVLGFAFSEKLWLEFSISGLRDIEWNEGAFDSLVLPDNQKAIVRALVESHNFDAAKTIDDMIQGKGKGLVAVLHGPPGTGKTLTAEGIAELLKCPLYTVSAGELGTDPRILEHELQKILDIAHAWGALLLLDEADVFLEKREIHDIHRNALVSIFLRLLEYFQGILFLTTNRVETFDDAFQSRIHVALRYGELTAKAKKAVWKLFLDKVRVMETAGESGVSSRASESSNWSADGVAANAKGLVSLPSSFKESDYDALARRPMNGRQIKNAVRTSQALAINRKEALAMRHIIEVLDVAESFEHDLRGGTGYVEAMRSYT